MQLSPLVDKQSLENLPDLPRMMGETDVALISNILEKLPENARLIEFGPWLGGVSALFAKYGELHVVDRFVWTAQNAENHPNVLQVGESFRPVFEANLADRNFKATIHETLYEQFEWSHGTLDFCLIDAPRDGHGLLHCLKSIGMAMSPQGYILVKHGLNPAQLEMMCLIDLLLRRNILALVPTGQPKWCNIAVLQPGEHIAMLKDIEFTPDIFANVDLRTPNTDPWNGPLFQMARLAYLVFIQDWPAAYSTLAKLPQDTAYLSAWDTVEATLDSPKEAQPQLAVFSDLLCFQNAERFPRLAKSADTSLIWAIRSFWMHHSRHDWSATAIDLPLFENCFSSGALKAASRLGDALIGAHILEIGPNLALSGLAHIMCGAQSYLGVETQDALHDLCSSFPSIRHISQDDLPDEVSTVSIAILRDMAPGQDTFQSTLNLLLPLLPPETDVIAIQDTRIHVIRSIHAAAWKERS
ncbi:hypothetical protein Q4544_14310 [Cognatishimia sp. 1_MG-2023]|uniref:hypothetical protein n=1 Tax=Cognatishimia sp. 1_MG-2023 TaxID=3062642 RepID=UPI0026E29626|nr:hypothetical protein [Cognatishimia sp. 1_MG-2023]MDO6728108.1 hypothetical protein [Cognatishimia sp. 1_MG-2023]